MATAPRDPRDYELMAILLPDRADEENQASIDRILAFITQFGGEVTETLTDSPWGRRRLAYTIRHESVDYRDGFYMVVHFSSVPTAISELERELKLDTDIIRYLLVSDDPNAGEPVSDEVPAETVETGEDTPDAPAVAGAEAATEEAPATEDAAPAVDAADSAPVESTDAAVEAASDDVTAAEEPAPADAPAEPTTEE